MSKPERFKLDIRVRVPPNWHVEFCFGRVDDPTHSSITVPAETVAEAILIANQQGVRTEWIDAVIMES